MQEEAIRFLTNQVSTRILQEVKQLSKKQLVNENIDLGMEIRNLLRQGGFYRNQAIFDKTWSSLLQRAAKNYN